MASRLTGSFEWSGTDRLQPSCGDQVGSQAAAHKDSATAAV